MVPPLMSRGFELFESAMRRSLLGRLAQLDVVLRMGFRKHLIFEIWLLISPACICQFPALTNALDAGQYAGP
jgi:hypothetical protein